MIWAAACTFKVRDGFFAVLYLAQDFGSVSSNFLRDSLSPSDATEGWS